VKEIPTMTTAEATFTYFVLSKSNTVLFKTASKSQAYKFYAESMEAASVLKRPGIH
jgi:hypothetical protein